MQKLRLLNTCVRASIYLPDAHLNLEFAEYGALRGSRCCAGARKASTATRAPFGIRLLIGSLFSVPDMHVL